MNGKFKSYHLSRLRDANTNLLLNIFLCNYTEKKNHLKIMDIFDDNISIEKYTMDHPVYIEGIDYPSRTSRRIWPPPLANRQVAIPEMYPQNYIYGGVPSAMIGERETTIRARPSFVRRRKKISVNNDFTHDVSRA